MTPAVPVPAAQYEISRRLRPGDAVEHFTRGLGTVVAEVPGHPSLLRVEFPARGRVQTCKRVDLLKADPGSEA